MSTVAVDLHNPFPGLRPFRQSEADVFFGQDEQIEELFDRLGTARFVAVLGVSGCGKSSLVRAGLIPMLESCVTPKEPMWYVTVCRPGSSPIRNLAKKLNALLPATTGGSELTEVFLRRHSLALADYVEARGLKPQQRVLVVVDQFEELFRYRQESPSAEKEDEAALFVKLLLGAAQDPESHVYVVITMRSEYIGDCGQFYGLSEAVNSGLYLVPKMTRAQCSEVITGPVLQRGAAITPELVQMLLNEVDEREDGLPLLQHSLRLIWEEWVRWGQTDAPIGRRDFDLPGADPRVRLIDLHLDRHLNNIYDELSAPQQEIATRLFKLLTDRDSKGREMRRPTPLSEIVAVTGATQEEVNTVVSHFRDEVHGRTFLAPCSGEPDERIDLSHECLMRRWGKLRTWMKSEQQDAEQFRVLADAADRKTLGQGGRLSGKDLESIDRWCLQFHPSSAWAARYAGAWDEELRRPRRDYTAAMEFLEASRERRRYHQEESAQAAKQARLEKLHAEARARKFRIYKLVSIVAVVVLAIAGAVLAKTMQLKRQAQKSAESEAHQRSAAERNAAEAKQAKEAAENATHQIEMQATRLAAINKELLAGRQQVKLANNQLEQKNQELTGTNGQLIDRSNDLARTKDDLNLALTSLRGETAALEKSSRDLAVTNERLTSLNEKLLGQQEQARRIQKVRSELEAARAGHSAGNRQQAILSVVEALEALKMYARSNHASEFLASDPATILVERALTKGAQILQEPLRIAQHDFPPFTRSVAYDAKENRFIGVGVNDQNKSTGIVIHDPGKTLSRSSETERLAGKGVAKVASFLFNRHVSEVAQAATISADARWVAEGTSEGYVFTFTPSDDSTFRRVRPRHYPITIVVFSPDGKFLASASGAGGWGLVDLQTGKEIAHDDGRELMIVHLAVSNGGNWVAYVTKQGAFRLVDIHRGKSTEVAAVSGSGIRSIDVSAKGAFAVARDKWASSKQCVLFGGGARAGSDLCAFADPVTAVAFSPSGELFAAASARGTVKIWNFAKRELLATYTGLPDSISEIRFNPGEKSFTLLGENGSAEVWPVDAPQGREPWRLYAETITRNERPLKDEDLQAAIDVLNSTTKLQGSLNP